MSVQTTHIRLMLQEAIEACERAEKISRTSTVPQDPTVERLLHGAITHSLHAAAEIRDESFRHRYGDDGFTR